MGRGIIGRHLCSEEGLDSWCFEDLRLYVWGFFCCFRFLVFWGFRVQSERFRLWDFRACLGFTIKVWGLGFDSGLKGLRLKISWKMMLNREKPRLNAISPDVAVSWKGLAISLQSRQHHRVDPFRTRWQL